ncbi:MAG: hypothetical protein AAFR76_02380 [Planctomycetota bacterium]
MKTQTKMLFGGALLSAGMAANASAQQFQLSGTQGAYDDTDTFLSVEGYDYYSVGYFDLQSVNGGIGDSLTYALPSNYGPEINGYGTASISSARIAATSYADVIDYDGFISTRASAAVTVDRNATLELAWDFTRAGFEVGNRQSFIVFDEMNGVLLFDAPLNSLGAESIEVFAGVDYVIGMRVSTGVAGVRPPFGPFSISFASATLIPSPASAALLGLGGLAAARRRR